MFRWLLRRFNHRMIRDENGDLRCLTCELRRVT